MRGVYVQHCRCATDGQRGRRRLCFSLTTLFLSTIHMRSHRFPSSFPWCISHTTCFGVTSSSPAATCVVMYPGAETIQTILPAPERQSNRPVGRTVGRCPTSGQRIPFTIRVKFRVFCFPKSRARTTLRQLGRKSTKPDAERTHAPPDSHITRDWILGTARDTTRRRLRGLGGSPPRPHEPASRSGSRS